MLGSRFMIVALFAVVVLLPEKVSAQSFDPHDLSGMWVRTVRDHSLGTKAPPLAQAGIDAMKGRIGDTDDVLREVIEAARASSQVSLNDNGVETNAPWLECNPMGFPRLLNDDDPIEFIITKDKILKHRRNECGFPSRADPGIMWTRVMEYPIPGAGLHRPVLRGRFSGAHEFEHAGLS